MTSVKRSAAFREIVDTLTQVALQYHTYGARFREAVADAAMRCELPEQVITDTGYGVRSQGWADSAIRNPAVPRRDRS